MHNGAVEWHDHTETWHAACAHQAPPWNDDIICVLTLVKAQTV